MIVQEMLSSFIMLHAPAADDGGREGVECDPYLVICQSPWLAALSDTEISLKMSMFENLVLATPSMYR